jgi:hypothetical protein
VASTAAAADEADVAVAAGRKPLPISEIEPHYSREPTQVKAHLADSKSTEDKSEQVPIR